MSTASCKNSISEAWSLASRKQASALWKYHQERGTLWHGYANRRDTQRSCDLCVTKSVSHVLWSGPWSSAVLWVEGWNPHEGRLCRSALAQAKLTYTHPKSYSLKCIVKPPKGGLFYGLIHDAFFEAFPTGTPGNVMSFNPFRSWHRAFSITYCDTCVLCGVIMKCTNLTKNILEGENGA